MQHSKLVTTLMRSTLVLGMIVISACSKKGASSSRLSSGSTSSSSAISIAFTEPSSGSWINSQSDSAQYRLTGTCTESDQSKLDGSTVTVKEDTTTLGTGECVDGTFSVSIDSTALTEGSHSIKATVSDSAGVSATSQAMNIKRDVTAPQLDQVTGPTLASVDATVTTTYTLSFLDTNLGTLSNSLIASSISFTGDYSGCRASVTGSGPYRGVNVTNCNGSGTVGIAVDGTKLHDLAGNAMTVVAGPYTTFAVTNAGPAIHISSPLNHGWSNATANSAAYSVQGTCSVNNGAVTISVDSGAVTGSGTCNGSTFSGAIDTTSLSAGSHSLTASITDGSATATSSSEFSVDVTSPTVSISNPRVASVSSSRTTSFTLTFDDLNASVLSGSSINSAITVNSGTCTKTTSITGTNKALVTLSGCTGNGTPTITVGAGAWADLAGNPVVAATSNSFTIDNAMPTVAITSPANNGYITPATDSANFAVSGTCSEASRVIYLQIDGGSFSSFATCGGANTFSGTINTTTLSTGIHTLVAKISDAAGNTISSSTITMTKVDSQPTVSVTTDRSPTVKSSDILVYVTFSEDVTGFDVNDVSVSGGTASGMAGIGSVYSFKVAPTSMTAQTDLLVTIPEGAGLDVDSNPNAQATLTIAFYPAPTSVVGTSPGTITTPTVTVGGGVAGLTAYIYSDSACSLPALIGTSSTMTGSSVSIDSNAISEDTTFYARFSDGTDFSACSTANFAYDLNSVRPTVSLTTSNNANPTTATSIPMTVTFERSVTGFDASDITVTGGTVTGFDDTNNPVFTFNFVPTPASTGTFTVDVPNNVAQDSGGNGNHLSATVSKTYYTSTPSVSRTPASTNSSAPTMTISGIIGSLTANLYSDSNCSTSKGSIAATGTSASVVSDSISTTTTYHADVTDSAGNKSACSSGFVLTYDTTGPANATGLQWATASTTNSSIGLSWTKSTDAELANQTLSFYSQASCAGSATDVDLASAATQSYTYVSGGNGTYSFKVTSVDLAGNSSTSSCSGSVTVTLPTPSISPTSISYPAAQAASLTFTASGGSGGFTYSVVSGAGTIDSSTGVYTASAPRAVGSTTVVMVTDSSNASVTATITHIATNLVNGTVNAIAKDASSIYVGGTFTAANSAQAKGLMSVNGTTGEILDYAIAAGFPSGSTIKNVVASGDFIYVGGTFTSYRGTTVQNLAKINYTTGALDTTFTQTTGPNNTVHSLVLNGSSLYIGGSFNGYRAVSGNNYKYVLKLDTTTGNLDTAFVPTFGTYSGNVYALHIAHSLLYVGGDFAGSNGNTAQNTLIKVNLASGSSAGIWNMTNEYPGTVYAITSDGSDLIVGGAMTKWISSTATIDANLQKLIRINPANGRATATFNTSTYPNGTVRALAVSGTSLYVGGDFTIYRGNVKGAYFAKVGLSDGVLDTTSFHTLASNHSPNASVNAIAVSSDGNSVYLGGAFTTYRGNSQGRNLAKLNATTGVLDTASFNSSSAGLDGTAVNSIFVQGTTVHVGGVFNGYRGTPVQNLAKFSLSTYELDTTFTQTTGPNGAVNALVVKDSDLYVGGAFTQYRGSANGAYLVKVNTTSGNLDSIFNSSATQAPNGVVHALANSGTNLYVGGAFTTYGNSASKAKAAYLTKVDTVGNNIDTTNFHPSALLADFGPTGKVRSIVLSSNGSDLYLGGEFLKYRGSTSGAYLAKANALTGALNLTFHSAGSSTPNGFVHVLALSPSNADLYLGGAFTEYRASGVGKYLTKVGATDGVRISTFNNTSAKTPNAAVNAITVSSDGSSLFIGGAFTQYRADSKGYYLVKATTADGTMDATFNAVASNGPNAAVNALLFLDASKLYVGGAHSAYRGDGISQYFTPVSTSTGATSW